MLKRRWKYFTFLFLLVINCLWLGGVAQQPVKKVPDYQVEKKFKFPVEIIEAQLVTVPSLIGQPHNRDRLAALLDKYGLQLGESLPQPNNDSLNLVTRQWPAAEQRVFRETPVNVVFAVEELSEIPVPPQLIIVPGYIGMQVEEAVSRMPNDRLRPGQITELHSEFPPGTVTGQFPDSGMQVDPETFVQLTVSFGPLPVQKVQVPPVVGLVINQAAVRLRETFLFVGNITEQTSEEREGTVIDQSPASGTSVDIYSPVDLTVSTGIDLVIVPDVLELFREDAIRVLEDSRLGYLLVFERSSGRPENSVLAQKPEPGSQVPAGTAVRLVLAQKKFSPWIFWGGAVAAAVLLGGLSGYRIKKYKDRQRVSDKKHLKLNYNLSWDNGTQSISHHGTQSQKPVLHLKYITD